MRLRLNVNSNVYEHYVTNVTDFISYSSTLATMLFVLYSIVIYLLYKSRGGRYFTTLLLHSITVMKIRNVKSVKWLKELKTKFLFRNVYFYLSCEIYCSKHHFQNRSITNVHILI